MIARVVLNDKVYDSFVFAIEYKGWDSKVIVFDENFENLITLSIWSQVGRKKVLIVDQNSDNYFIDNDKFVSYWNDDKIFKNLYKKNNYQKYLNEAKIIQQNITKIGWVNIATGNDIENLFSSIFSFHDAVVINMNCYDDRCDMFIDTTWGSYVQLKFKGVKENNIEIQDMFFSASYEITDDGFKLIFDSASDKEYSFIEAKGIEYKLYIKKTKDLDEININELLESNSFINIQPYDNDVVGTIFMYDTNLSLELFYDDYILCISKGSKTPKENYFKRKYSHIISMFNEFGYKLSEYPKFDDSIYGPDFVNVIYQEKINEIKTFLNYFKFCLIPIMINIVFWLVIKLLSQMNWLGFYIFGIGLSFILTILYVIIGLKNYWKKSSIVIYDNGIKCTGLFNLCLEYEYITQIENKRRIVIKTNYSTYKLPKTKNKEYIYNLILEKINNK